MAIVVQVSLAQADNLVVLPVRVHVAASEQGPVVSEGFVAERIAKANAIFEPYGVRFEVQSTVPLPPAHAALETRVDRDRLGAYAQPGVIDCFVVSSLRDVDDPTQMRRGVHWHSQTHRGRHFVVISSISGPDVLAHELGHYLGNPGHSDVAGNLMSYTPADVLPFLDEAQQRKMMRRLRRYLSSGELRVIDPNASAAP